jgi:hypothetical protein
MTKLIKKSTKDTTTAAVHDQPRKVNLADEIAIIDKTVDDSARDARKLPRQNRRIP